MRFLLLSSMLMFGVGILDAAEPSKSGLPFAHPPATVAPMPREVVPCCDGGGLFAAVFQEKKPGIEAKYGRGRKPAPPEVTKARHAAAAIRHDGRITRLPEVVAPAFDCRDMGWCHPIKDQGQCLPAGTPVLMADNSWKAIDLIRAGDKVVSAEGNIVTVLGDYRRPVKNVSWITLEALDYKINLTGNHEVLTCGDAVLSVPEYIRADKLSASSLVVVRNRFIKGGGTVTVTPVRSIKSESYTGWVYNIETDGDKSYVANHIGVHNCGSCYQFSGAGPCTDAFIKAGQKSIFSTGNGFAEQYGMDCHRNWGGCNGGDELDIISWAKTNGLPTESDYGTYRGGSVGTCKTAPKMHKIADWGYCTLNQGQGIAATADMQKCIAAYGPISVAVDASAFNSYNGGIMRGNGNNVDHAVMCIGWKTQANGKVAFLGQNQWGTSWGENGYFWIEEGSYSWGTEAIWVVATALPPPPPPPSPFTVTLTTSVATGLSPLATTFSYTSAGGTATSAAIDFGDNTSSATMPATHTYTMPGVYVATLRAQADGGSASAKVTITVTAGPVPPPPVPPSGTIGDVTISTDAGNVVVKTATKKVTLAPGYTIDGTAVDSLIAELKTAGVSDEDIAAVVRIVGTLKNASKPGPGMWRMVPRRERMDGEPVMVG